jgi:hypothetical protein
MSEGMNGYERKGTRKRSYKYLALTNYVLDGVDLKVVLRLDPLHHYLHNGSSIDGRRVNVTL